MIIKDYGYKIKAGWAWFLRREKDLFILGLVVITALFSYGLGRLAKIEALKPPVTISGAAIPAVTSSGRGGEGGSGQLAAVAGADIPTAAPVTNGSLVASKNGHSFYYPWCGGLSRIKSENRIYFKTRVEAEAAGLKLATNCKDRP